MHLSLAGHDHMIITLYYVFNTTFFVGIIVEYGPICQNGCFYLWNVLKCKRKSLELQFFSTNTFFKNFKLKKIIPIGLYIAVQNKDKNIWRQRWKKVLLKLVSQCLKHSCFDVLIIIMMTNQHIIICTVQWLNTYLQVRPQQL